MEITCKHCGSRFRAAIQLPLTAPVRVVCPACRNQMVLKPTGDGSSALAPPSGERVAEGRVRGLRGTASRPDHLDTMRREFGKS